MYSYCKILIIFLLAALVQSYPVVIARRELPAFESIRKNSKRKIQKETAIEIAKRHALKRYKSLKRFRVVACELSIFWRVIFDGGGPEYVIDKETGAIRRIHQIDQDWPERSNVGYSGKRSSITRNEAIDVAKRVFESVPGVHVESFTIVVCELKRVWRVFIEPKLHLEPGMVHPIIPHSSAPNYVIDKRTGEILFRQR